MATIFSSLAVKHKHSDAGYQLAKVPPVWAMLLVFTPLLLVFTPLLLVFTPLSARGPSGFVIRVTDRYLGSNRNWILDHFLQVVLSITWNPSQS